MSVSNYSEICWVWQPSSRTRDHGLISFWNKHEEILSSFQKDCLASDRPGPEANFPKTDPNPTSDALDEDETLLKRVSDEMLHHQCRVPVLQNIGPRVAIFGFLYSKVRIPCCLRIWAL